MSPFLCRGEFHTKSFGSFGVAGPVAMPHAALVLLFLPRVASHASVVFPVPRNALDRTLPAFAGGGFPVASPFGCNCGSSSGCSAGTGTSARAGGNGQACAWFSQGCSIGCATCDNKTQHTNGNATCEKPMEPLLDEPVERTINRHAAAGSAQDTYRYNPWRAPGYAPVNDACGMAGGAPTRGPGHAFFSPVPWAKQGDLGTRVLQKGPPAASWVAGDVVEVGWALRFNHGGGYQYRICPAHEALTEECFARHPLVFNGSSDRTSSGYKQILRWTNGTQQTVDASLVWVSPPHERRRAADDAPAGPNPVGYPWALNPIPRINFDSSSSGQPSGAHGCTKPAIGAKCIEFTPPCKGDTGWRPVNGTRDMTDVAGECSGDATGVTVVDRLLLPRELPAGEYVLGCASWSQSSDLWVVPSLLPTLPAHPEIAGSTSCSAAGGGTARRRRRCGARALTCSLMRMRDLPKGTGTRPRRMRVWCEGAVSRGCESGVCVRDRLRVLSVGCRV